MSIGAGCYNVDIRNITCGPSHGIRYYLLLENIAVWFLLLFINNKTPYTYIYIYISVLCSIGSLGMRNTRACVSNITVTDSVIRNSDNGVRIKTWQGGSGAVSGVTFHNIHMDTVRNPIIIDQYYCTTKICPNQTSAVHVSDILYSNIKGTYDIRSPAIHFSCSDSLPCTNLTLSGVELLPSRGQYISNPLCWNAYGNMLTQTVPPASCLLEGIPDMVHESYVDRC